MERVLTPELLDSLPGNDPRAIRSRADLRRLNSWMGNGRHIQSALQQIKIDQPATILELGCGDGTFILQFARSMHSHWRGPIELFLLDQQNIIHPPTLEALRALGWTPKIITDDLRLWLRQYSSARIHIVLANLILHHFTDMDLRELFSSLARSCHAFIACEPRRWPVSLMATRLLWMIACNQVTRHDARVSVEAGFRGKELTSIWPPESGFELTEIPAGFTSHLFFARRITAD